ncbi:MAG: 30S ribosomal protein S20 [Breznakia sp.]
MPNIKQQKKRVITNNKKNLVNAAQKTKLRTAIKAVHSAIEENDAQAATKAYALASKYLDQAVTSKLYHKNYVSRQKSRLALAVNAIK